MKELGSRFCRDFPCLFTRHNFASYTLAEEELVQSSLPMKSVAFPKERALCHAIRCTVEILKTAIKYLEGKSGNQDTQEVVYVTETPVGVGRLQY